jgi:hypothetical protein
VYFSTAILAGVLVGLLLPLARAGRFGAAVVGHVAAGTLAATIKIADKGFTGWSGEDLVDILVYGLLLGVPVGLAYRRIFRDVF